MENKIDCAVEMKFQSLVMLSALSSKDTLLYKFIFAYHSILKGHKKKQNDEVASV
jgi:hypothetical protein